jgi:hypothetical protein
VLSAPTSPKSFVGTGRGFDLRIVDPEIVNAQIYVSQAGQQGFPSAMNDYHAPNKKNKKPFCYFPNLRHSIVAAIEVDKTGELWIPLDSKIVSYAPNCGAAGTALSDPSVIANDIAFDSKGTRYVSNNYDVNRGDVSVYPKGATSPTRKLKDSAVLYSYGVGVDSHDNVYESFINSPSFNKGGVVEYRGGRMPGKLLENVMSDSQGPPTFDKSDNLIITNDNASTGTVDIYAPPYDNAPASFATKGYSTQCSLGREETNIACADSGNGTVDVYKYPDGTYMYSFNKGLLGAPATTVGVAQDRRQ